MSKLREEEARLSRDVASLHEELSEVCARVRWEREGKERQFEGREVGGGDRVLL